MKTKNIFLAISIFLIISCGDPGGEEVFDGFSIRVSNNTNESYEGKLILGGLKDNVFVPTDSIESVKEFEFGTSKLFNDFVNENRWKPNLDKIRNLPSERCYFKLKMSNGREEMLVFFNSTDFFNLKLPNTKNFVGGFGRIYINIFDTEIVGHSGERQE